MEIKLPKKDQNIYLYAWKWMTCVNFEYIVHRRYIDKISDD